MQAVAALIVAVSVIVLSGGASDEFDRGLAANMRGEPEAAIYHYTRALENDELSQHNRARALNNRAIAHDRKGDYAHALADYRAAMRITPDDVEIARNRDETLRRRELERMDPFGRETMKPALVSLGQSTEDPSGSLQLKEKERLLGLL